MNPAKGNTICNFCLSSLSKQKLKGKILHACENCFNEAFSTHCFEVISPNDQHYKIHLIRKNKQPSSDGLTAQLLTLLKQIDQSQQYQITSVLAKWMHISETMSRLKSFQEDRIERIKQIFRKDTTLYESVQFQTNALLQKEIADDYQYSILEYNEKPKRQQNQVDTKQSTIQKQNQQNDQRYQYQSPIKEDITQNQQGIEDYQEDINYDDEEYTQYQYQYQTQQHETQEHEKTDVNGDLKVFPVPKKVKRRIAHRSKMSFNKQHYKFKKNQAENLAPDFYDYHIENWGKGGLFMSSGRYPNKSQNIIDIEKAEFLSKIYALKTKITHYLENQSKISSVLQKIVADNICQAVLTTSVENKCIQLISYKITKNFDFKCYLTMLEWKDVEILKLVKVQLLDDDCKILLDFIKDKQVGSLVLTNNKITQDICKYLANNPIPNLKNIYLGKNQIVTIKARKQIKQLKQHYNLYL